MTGYEYENAAFPDFEELVTMPEEGADFLGCV